MRIICIIFRYIYIYIYNIYNNWKLIDWTKMSQRKDISLRLKQLIRYTTYISRTKKTLHFVSRMHLYNVKYSYKYYTKVFKLYSSVEINILFEKLNETYKRHISIDYFRWFNSICEREIKMNGGYC